MSDAFSRESVGRWLMRQYLDALLQGDLAEAERVARDALDAGLGAPGLYSTVIAPAMREVGVLWERGEITVADEHLATTTSTRIVALAGHLGAVAADREGARVLAATVDGELHVLGLEMATQVLEDAGYEVLMLGASVPTGALLASVDRYEPAIVALGATMPEVARTLREAVTMLRTRGMRVVAGGPAAERLTPEPSGVVVCDVADVVEQADVLRQRPSLN